MRKTRKTFSVQPLTATLFDPKRTPLLDNANLTNLCLQKVILRLSLSQDDRSRTIGRVNYAELGINQLGAVYEGLLSYKGMFADQDLIQVKPAKKSFADKKTPTWFVPKERLEEFKKDEVERLKDGKPRIYPMGSFILHLSGIDREQSASYYTPEVLTKCLVEEALRELLKDYQPEDADRILGLKICEPAMGSGAFLNEATEQLANRYLELKQKQIGRTIEPSRYLDELRRAKHYIATRNVYGVDLNATAVELGALSLWLGSIHRLLVEEGENGDQDVYQPGATPWFGLRLRCGNSLIGARRAVWTTTQLAKGKQYGKNSNVPRLLKPGEKRKENEIYHFLVFDEDMVPAHKDKLMRDFWPEECETAKKWINKQVKSKWSQPELKEALTICDLIDSHWQIYSDERQAALEETECTASVWPEPSNSENSLKEGPSLADQETLCGILEDTSGSFQRLKLLMDTWCALWFWPLVQVGELPKRDSFLTAAGLLLGDKPPDKASWPLLSARLGFEVEVLVRAAGEKIPDTGTLTDAVSWFRGGQELAGEQNFHHWELIFPEVLGLRKEGGGFDLIVGNPPWIKVGWSDAPILRDFEPLYGVQEKSSAELNQTKKHLLVGEERQAEYAKVFFSQYGIGVYLKSKCQFSELAGIQVNLYKNFVIKSWEVISKRGIAALLHPDGIYEDSQGGQFRARVFPRLRAHFQLRNQLMLFRDIPHREEFSINIYGKNLDQVKFLHISNIFHPSTIGGSISHRDKDKPIPAIKNSAGKWDLKPHYNRLIIIQRHELELFAKLFEAHETVSLEARLPQIHSLEVLEVLEKISKTKSRLVDHRKTHFPTEMFHESEAQKGGIITRCLKPTYQPKTTNDMVLSGPHFFVGIPIYQTVRTSYISKGSYDEIDLTVLGENYLPRAVFKPG